MNGIRTVGLLVLTGIAMAAAAQQDEAAESTESTESTESATDPATVIDELSQAEIDAELARAEGMLDETGEVKEFTDTKPLPADLPLALPSDF